MIIKNATNQKQQVLFYDGSCLDVFPGQEIVVNYYKVPPYEKERLRKFCSIVEDLQTKEETKSSFLEEELVIIRK